MPACTQTSKPDDYTILPDVISKEPLGPAVRRGDDDWFQITRWSLNAMLEAEEAGLAQGAEVHEGLGGMAATPDKAGGGEDGDGQFAGDLGRQPAPASAQIGPLALQRLGQMQRQKG